MTDTITFIPADGGVGDEGPGMRAQTVEASNYFDNGSILADMAVERHGKKIILPDDPAKMTARQAIERLEKLEQDEEEIVSVNHVIEGVHYYDGLIGLTKAIQRIYGWTEIRPTPGFFGPIPPQVTSIPVGVGRSMRVVTGRTTSA